MTEQDPTRFDLVAALKGRTYPEDTVTIFLDEAKMYEYAKASRDADHDPMNEEKQELAKKIFNDFKEIAITVTLKSAPRHVVKAVEEEIEEKYPSKFSAFGILEPNAAREEEFNLRLWSIYIQRMELSDGTFSVPSPEEIATFRDAAPQVALEVVAKAIDDLFEVTKSGYEQIVKDPDFLSQRSRTE